MKEGQLIGTLERGFREPETKQAARQVFGSKTMKDIQQFSAARKLPHRAAMVGKTLAGLGGIGTAAALISRLFQR